MTINHKINDFLFELFPDTKGDREKLIDAIKRFYTEGPFEPQVSAEDDLIHVTFDADRIEADKEKFEKLVSLAENKKYDEAQELASELIEQSPNVSEYHRILGQIYSETGDQNEAVNSLIDALKWNPKNEWALLMMGNIYAKYKDDIETAITFYEQILTFKPDDYLALNNIGAQLLQANEYDEALPYFEKAHTVKPDYPNTLYALATIFEEQGNFLDAFDKVVQSIKKNSKKDELYQRSVQRALSIAKSYENQSDTEEIVNQFISELSYKTEKEIKKQEDDSISTAAKIEYAEVHNRPFHLIKYKSDRPGIHHLILHELTHLELATQAREENTNKLFTTNNSLREQFLLQHKKEINKLQNKGVPESNVRKYFLSMYDGLNSQIFNTPIDLFIEDRIYNRFEKLRPIQFLSLLSMVQEGIQATTKPEIIKNAPSKILSNSIVYSLVNAFHLRDLYGVDLISQHKPKKSELNKAKKFYKEFQEYRNSKEPAEEYELIQYWADDLNLSSYFELVDEEPTKQQTADTILDSIEKDPYGLDEDDPVSERQMKQFLEHHADDDINQSVVMYMVSALQYFSGMPKEEVKKIAMEIAQVGITGIDPKKDGYHIPSIKGSSFSGYKTLAYYYVSWAIAIPEMLSQLQMPFDKEYETAKEFLKK